MYPADDFPRVNSRRQVGFSQRFGGKLGKELFAVVLLAPAILNLLAEFLKLFHGGNLSSLRILSEKNKAAKGEVQRAKRSKEEQRAKSEAQRTRGQRCFNAKRATRVR